MLKKTKKINIYDLELPIRAISELEKNGVRTLGGLIKRRKDLNGYMTGIGPYYKEIIEKALNKLENKLTINYPREREEDKNLPIITF